VALTLYHCLNYYYGGEKKINGDFKPFIKVESHFIDLSSLKKHTAPKDAMSTMISLIGKHNPEAVKNS